METANFTSFEKIIAQPSHRVAQPTVSFLEDVVRHDFVQSVKIVFNKILKDSQNQLIHDLLPKLFVLRMSQAWVHAEPSDLPNRRTFRKTGYQKSVTKVIF